MLCFCGKRIVRSECLCVVPRCSKFFYYLPCRVVPSNTPLGASDLRVSIFTQWRVVVFWSPEGFFLSALKSLKRLDPDSSLDVGSRGPHCQSPTGVGKGSLQRDIVSVTSSECRRIFLSPSLMDVVPSSNGLVPKDPITLDPPQSHTHHTVLLTRVFFPPHDFSDPTPPGSGTLSRKCTPPSRSNMPPPLLSFARPPAREPGPTDVSPTGSWRGTRKIKQPFFLHP